MRKRHDGIHQSTLFPGEAARDGERVADDAGTEGDDHRAGERGEDFARQDLDGLRCQAGAETGRCESGPEGRGVESARDAECHEL